MEMLGTLDSGCQNPQKTILARSNGNQGSDPTWLYP